MENNPENSPLPGWLGTMQGQSTPASPNAAEVIRRAAAEVMAIQDVTLGGGEQPTRIRGQLMVSAEEAFKRMRPQFESVGHTPHLRHEEDRDVIRALPVVFGKAKNRSRVAIILLILTILSVFYVGMSQTEGLYIDPINAAIAQITHNTTGISHPSLLPTPQQWQTIFLTGIFYTMAMLGILGTHEMGHYILARINKVQTTLPFFIPMPFGFLGTMGAVIAMREPAPNRKVQFDIGIAGPLAGLIVAIPVMFVGLSLSHVSTRAAEIAKAPPEVRGEMGFSQEGQSLLYLGMKYIMFGEILPKGDRDVFIHPVAFAAWAGFLVTALNLIPVGQLDGGHVLFGLFGDKANRARMPAIIILSIMAVAGLLRETGTLDLGFGWAGWALWVAILFFLMRGHAPVLDEITGLDTKRRALGFAMLVVFILLFTPTPLQVTGQPVSAILRLFM